MVQYLLVFPELNVFSVLKSARTKVDVFSDKELFRVAQENRFFKRYSLKAFKNSRCYLHFDQKTFRREYVEIQKFNSS